MKPFYQVHAILILITAFSFAAQAQMQIGSAINGVNAQDNAGVAVSMPDANTVAVGAPYYDGNGYYSGHVRVFTWDGSTWIQKGQDIDGEVAYDESGWTVSMPDANTVAIGAESNDGNGVDAGHVRVYSWNGSAWVQKGADIDGESADDNSGWALSMPDANTVAIGAPYNDGNGADAGHVRIYVWSGTTWVQKGADIDGKATGDYFGDAVSMPDANTVAVGAPFNDANGMDAGQVRVYTWSGGAWIHKGASLEGQAAGDYAGDAVSMPDANTMAIGLPGNDDNGNIAGQVRVFTWNGSAWVQRWGDIQGEASGDYSGFTVTMPDTNILAIGAAVNDGNGNKSGHTRVFTWNGSAWAQIGADIDGEAPGDESSASLSMPDPTTLAIGAPNNDGNGTDAGHVRVYSLKGLGAKELIQDDFGNDITYYPNPTRGKLNIDLGKTYTDIAIKITDVLGRDISQKSIDNATRKFQLSIPGAMAIYFVKINTGNKYAVIKVIKIRE